MNPQLNVLNEELIRKKTGCKSLAEVDRINLWGLNLTDVSIIEKMDNLRIISLTSNNIENLSSFAKCSHLQELYLRQNKISDLWEFRHLQGLRDLRVLWVSDNPCTQNMDYRTKILSMLPKLYKLDDSKVTLEERESVAWKETHGVSVEENNVLRANAAKLLIQKPQKRENKWKSKRVIKAQSMKLVEVPLDALDEIDRLKNVQGNEFLKNKGRLTTEVIENPDQFFKSIRKKNNQERKPSK